MVSNGINEKSGTQNRRPPVRLDRLTPERDNVLVPLRDRFEDADLVPDLSCVGEAK
jgi:hypothetical protein